MIGRISKKQLAVIGVAILVGALVSLVFTILVNIIFPQPAFYFGVSRFIAIATIVSSTICLFYYRVYFIKNLHKAFLLLALAFGISFTLVFPRTVYVSPDDQIHLKNIYFLMEDSIELQGGFLATESISFTNLKNKGFDELSALYEATDNNDNVVIDSQSNINQVPPLYQRIIYLPYYIGLKASNLLRLSFTTGVVIAKICNLVCYVALVYIAIRESGKLRKIFFVIGLLMSNIFLSTQFSYDPIIIASLLLAISLFLHMRQSETVTKKYLLGFILAVTFGSLTKAVYCPLMLLILLIPNNKFDSYKRAIIFKICAMIVMVVLASTYVLPILGGSMASDARGGNTSVSGQLQFLLSNPIKGLAAIAYFFLGVLPGHLIGTLMFVNLGDGASSGMVYDTCSLVVPAVWAIGLITLLWATFSVDGQSIITKQLKIGVGIICTVLAGMVFASMYLSFTNVGSIYVEGLQPRYFMPFFPLFLLLLIPTKPKCQESTDSKVILFAPCLALALVFGIYVLRMSML